MTDKPTPKEMENLFVEETGFDTDDFPAAIFGFARAVLEKWGQPAQATEPVAVVVPCYTPSGKRVALYSAKQDLPIGTKLYAAPQPSYTAQAAEPVAWYEYNGDLDAWFLAYSHNPKAKTRPLVFGDTAPQPVAREPLTEVQINAAGKKMAECMDYPWAHMPEQGRAEMCKHAQAVIGAAYPLRGKQ